MEGRRKEIILLVLAVAALGIALYTFRGNKPAPAPAPVPAATAPGAARDEAAPGARGEQAATGAAQGTEGDASAAARNPFSTPGGVEAAPDVGGDSETMVEPPPDTAPGEGGASLTLTGIVDGKQSVAILRQDDQRFFVKVGDLVGEGYRVQSIGSQQVVLVGQQGKVILRMGGRQ
jgi:hypothetical protein